MAVNIKMGVDMSAFKSGISQANAQMKTFDAQMKLAESTFKKTGDAETAMATKTEALSGKLKTQKQVIDQYEKALEDMRKAGVDPMSKSYQQMQAAMLNVQSAANETEIALNGLSITQQNASNTANQLTESMNGIGKKISLEQVRGGIQSITDGLEGAAQKAVQLGEKLFSVIMDAASQADDISTMATRLGLTEEEVQQINYNAARFEVTAEQLGTTWKKVRNNMASDSKEIAEGFEKLGVKTHDSDMFGFIKMSRDYKDVFWETGEALMKMTDAAERERLAQKLLGRSWDEMIPLFTAGREEYEAALKAAPTASKEAVDNLASLNDRMAELEQSWNTLKLQALETIAPALEKGADAIAKMLDKVTEYLKTDEGQELLEKLGNSVSGLFDDLSKISPDEVVNNVTSVLTGLTGGLEWLSKNWEGVRDALIFVVEGWAAMKIGGGILDIVRVVSGLGDLVGIRAAGAAVGTAWGSGFGSALLAAVPWLAGVIALLWPSETGNNDLMDTGGNLTAEGWGNFIDARERASRGDTQDNGWYDDIMAVSEFIDEASKIWDDAQAVQAVARFAAGGHQDMDQLIEDLVALGYSRRVTEEELNQGLNLPEEVKRVTTDPNRGTIFKSRKPSEYGKLLPAEEIAEEVGPVDLDTHFVVSDDVDEDILKQLGIIDIPVRLSLQRTGGGPLSLDGITQLKYANGIPWINNDNTLALLHRGERVLTASENRHYTYNSNNYFGNVNLNNGQDIEALCDSIDRHNRRQGAGYGS